MAVLLRLPDPQLRTDLATYLGRAGRIEDGAVRVAQVPGGVSLWVPVLRPATILDDSPLVVGVRAIPGKLEGAGESDLVDGAVDVVVPLRGLLDRLARPVDEERALTLPLPPDRLHESWTGVLPPVGGWQRGGDLDGRALARIADSGIDEVARGTAGGLGQLRAERVRTEVWTRPLPDDVRLANQRVPATDDRSALRADTAALDLVPLPPAGAAFALRALGFLGDAPERVILASAPGWVRLGAARGQVLVRAKS